MPDFITDNLRLALPRLGQRLKGFDHPDALLTGPETRSSAPVRILRNPRRQSAFAGLYPLGEGAGYAGGIVSAAVDGLCAEWISTKPKNGGTAMNTKRLVTVAVLIALYTVLSLFSANLGLIKLTFESFPVLVASLMFGWVDGLLVGAGGGLLNQMLTYGFTVTTLMWILPNAVRGLLVGLYAKKHGLDLTMKQTAGIVLATSLLVTALNTVALYIDSQIFHYPISLTVGAIALRFLSSVVMAAVYTLVTPRTVALLHRANASPRNNHE